MSGVDSGRAPSVSVIICWRDRLELGRTLRENLPLLRARGAEIVVVNYGGQAAPLDALLAESGAAVRLVEVRAEAFNKSRALNIGIHFARGDHVLLLDADVILREFDFERAIALVDDGAWVTLKKVVESEARARPPGRLAQFASCFELVLDDGRGVRVETKRSYLGEGARSCAGIMLLKRADVIRIGGFHSGLEGWGWEDIDLHVRLSLVLQRRHAELGEGVHLSHGDERRSYVGASPDANNHRNQQRCLQRYNAGDFAGTYLADTQAFDFTPVAAT